MSLLAINLLLFGMASFSLAQEKIVIAGTGDSQEFLRILAAAFEKTISGKKVEVPDAIGTSGGIKATAEGRCDLGRTARPIKDKEKVYNLNYQVFANSPVVFAVNPSVKGVDNLTLEQIVGIFSGKIMSWSELGGGNQKIYIAQREKGDSCRSILEESIPGWKEIEQFPGEEIFSTPEAVSTIATYENTIGYVPLSMVKGTGLILLKIAGVYPSVENVKNGSYKETKEHIFEPFFTTKQVGEGTGLGLSIVYNIIQAHQGSIEVESQINKGTTFKIRLPSIS